MIERIDMIIKDLKVHERVVHEKINDRNDILFNIPKNFTGALG